MKKIDANGLIVSSVACVVYVCLAIILLSWFAAAWGIAGESTDADSSGIMKYYLAALLTIFGGVMMVLILYRLDSLMRKPAPEWVFALFGVVVPFAIYYGIPSFSQ